MQLDRLRELRGAEDWTIASVQALHRFYRRDGTTIAAGWMTREDRELMISDNIAYVDGVVDAIAREFGQPSALVFAGFSQGASMAYRAAASGLRRAAVIAVGGDVPPELDRDTLTRIPHALIGWGARDRFFTREIRDRDERRLRDAGVDVTAIDLDAAHEWTDAFSGSARNWVRAHA